MTDPRCDTGLEMVRVPSMMEFFVENAADTWDVLHLAAPTLGNFVASTDEATRAQQENFGEKQR